MRGLGGTALRTAVAHIVRVLLRAVGIK